MTTAPMTAGEQAELIDYALRFGHSVGKEFPLYRDEIVSASLHGAAIAFESPNFPEDVEGRRKFIGQCCWNMMRREISVWVKNRLILFSEIGTLYALDHMDDEDLQQPIEWRDAFEVYAEDDIEVQQPVDWADEFEFLSGCFEGRTHEVFIRAYGPLMLSQTEIAEQLGVGVSCVHKHMNKITDFARRRHERINRG